MIRVSHGAEGIVTRDRASFGLVTSLSGIRVSGTGGGNRHGRVTRRDRLAVGAATPRHWQSRWPRPRAAPAPGPAGGPGPWAQGPSGGIGRPERPPHPSLPVSPSHAS
jgi:hypothetical protein